MPSTVPVQAGEQWDRDLFREAALLSKLLRKNQSQHRGSSYFERLQEVQALVLLPNLVDAEFSTRSHSNLRKKREQHECYLTLGTKVTYCIGATIKVLPSILRQLLTVTTGAASAEIATECAGCQRFAAQHRHCQVRLDAAKLVSLSKANLAACGLLAAAPHLQLV